MTVFRSQYPDVDVPDTALSPYVFRHARDLAGHVALVDGTDGREFTFAQTVERIHRMAGGFAGLGVRPGVTVALMAPNCPEYAFVFHAVAVAGGTVTTVNPAYTADEVRFQLRDAGAIMIVAPGAVLPVVKEAVEGTDVATIIAFGAYDDADVLDLGAVDAEPIDQVDIDPATHVVVLPYSSGTTGLPKGVMLTHRNLVANLAQIAPVLRPEPGESALAVLPFFHIYGMQVLMNGMLANGVSVVTLPRFDLVAALQLIQDRRITRFFVVPPIILALAKHPIIDTFDLSSLRHVMSGAAPLGPEITLEASSRIDCLIGQGYGMTELSPVTHATPFGEMHPGVSGVLLPSTDCRIVDPESGADLGVDEVGELWIRGPQVMAGYLNNQAATDAMLTADGWLRTGDLAVVDADGAMTIVDRLKELIKVKGFQVAPAELEAILLGHPQVIDVAVIGVADDEAGEVPKAFIVAAPDSGLTVEDVQGYLAGHVATYKQVKAVEFVDAIPKSASGKILRRMLR